jgi:hypothetical protein
MSIRGKGDMEFVIAVVVILMLEGKRIIEKHLKNKRD